MKKLLTPYIWVCPLCGHNQDQNNDKIYWCGKNQQCNECKEHSYYSDWTILGEKPNE